MCRKSFLVNKTTPKKINTKQDFLEIYYVNDTKK